MFLDYQGYNKHVLIVGSARSGTSWLSEIIAQQSRYRMLFEPEHEFRTPKGHLICDQWITANHNTDKQNTYLKAIFSNRVDCDWIGQISNRKYKRHLWPFLPKMYIIKMVRGNLLASYVNNKYNIPTLHIIRNPYEVIHSQKRVNFPWLFDLSHFVNQPRLVALIKEHFDFDITNYQQLNDTQRLALRWCIENVIPLEVLKFSKGKFEVVRHEELVKNINLFYDLCERYGLEPLSDIETRYTKPSSKMHPRSQLLSKTNLINPLLDEIDMKHINTILLIFKTTLYPIDDVYRRGKK
ncbi:sulfotransferase domain-containing protein [Winogradskyella helgolandensis]|uniref:sulfotransferase domain-containing protein n=1 Tax=Winogradskyella helgolandensis TaxID=2697010 RepID=UPI0015CE596D|nr:sulfotransferase domain-containing protein [Winogradskyella helgolandensis]